ncbi:FkbM family methyltransferase [uncultured Roseobacter sp.]|uniref:FkbM family methyltransferase n=1 Tax=uncultured Roseobacter sp. TaxID=114847 RepID=UPI0026267D93|nr:FkbM family methyltransferase [uncultured Roseobacter sp.]
MASQLQGLNHQMRRKIRRLLGLDKVEAEQKAASKPGLVTANPEFVDGFLTGLIAREGKIGVLQCGANDGVTVDPINRFLIRNKSNVKAVLVEPLPDVFEQLKENYAGNENVACLNVALGPEGKLTLYRLKAEYSDRYRGIIASGITSFDRNHVLKKSMNLVGIDEIPPEDRVEEVEVECMTVSRLIDDHADRLSDQPFVQIDAEGFDDQVVYSVDLERHRPLGFGYEFNKLSIEKLGKLREHLARHGYSTVTWSKSDELAYLVRN